MNEVIQEVVAEELLKFKRALSSQNNQLTLTCYHPDCGNGTEAILDKEMTPRIYFQNSCGLGRFNWRASAPMLMYALKAPVTCQCGRTYTVAIIVYNGPDRTPIVFGHEF